MGKREATKNKELNKDQIFSANFVKSDGVMRKEMIESLIRKENRLALIPRARKISGYLRESEVSFQVLYEFEMILAQELHPRSRNHQGAAYFYERYFKRRAEKYTPQLNELIKKGPLDGYDLLPMASEMDDKEGHTFVMFYLDNVVGGIDRKMGDRLQFIEGEVKGVLEQIRVAEAKVWDSLRTNFLSYMERNNKANCELYIARTELSPVLEKYAEQLRELLRKKLEGAKNGNGNSLSIESPVRAALRERVLGDLKKLENQKDPARFQAATVQLFRKLNNEHGLDTTLELLSELKSDQELSKRMRNLLGKIEEKAAEKQQTNGPGEPSPTGREPGTPVGTQDSATAAGVAAGTEPDAVPAVAVGTEPDATPGVTAGTEPAAPPGVEPGTEPAAAPGVEPSAEPGAAPGVDPGTEPAAPPGVEPNAEPAAGTEPAATPGVEPGTEPGVIAGDDPSVAPGIAADASTEAPSSAMPTEIEEAPPDPVDIASERAEELAGLKEKVQEREEEARKTRELILAENDDDELIRKGTRILNNQWHNDETFEIKEAIQEKEPLFAELMAFFTDLSRKVTQKELRAVVDRMIENYRHDKEALAENPGLIDKLKNYRDSLREEPANLLGLVHRKLSGISDKYSKKPTEMIKRQLDYLKECLENDMYRPVHPSLMNIYESIVNQDISPTNLRKLRELPMGESVRCLDALRAGFAQGSGGASALDEITDSPEQEESRKLLGSEKKGPARSLSKLFKILEEEGADSNLSSDIFNRISMMAEDITANPLKLSKMRNPEVQSNPEALGEEIANEMHDLFETSPEKARETGSALLNSPETGPLEREQILKSFRDDSDDPETMKEYIFHNVVDNAGTLEEKEKAIEEFKELVPENLLEEKEQAIKVEKEKLKGPSQFYRLFSKMDPEKKKELVELLSEEEHIPEGLREYIKKPSSLEKLEEARRSIIESDSPVSAIIKYLQGLKAIASAKGLLTEESSKQFDEDIRHFAKLHRENEAAFARSKPRNNFFSRKGREVQEALQKGEDPVAILEKEAAHEQGYKAAQHSLRLAEAVAAGRDVESVEDLPAFIKESVPEEFVPQMNQALAKKHELRQVQQKISPGSNGTPEGGQDTEVQFMKELDALPFPVPRQKLKVLYSKYPDPRRRNMIKEVVQLSEKTAKEDVEKVPEYKPHGKKPEAPAPVLPASFDNLLNSALSQPLGFDDVAVPEDVAAGKRKIGASNVRLEPPPMPALPPSVPDLPELDAEEQAKAAERRKAAQARSKAREPAWEDKVASSAGFKFLDKVTGGRLSEDEAAAASRKKEKAKAKEAKKEAKKESKPKAAASSEPTGVAASVESEFIGSLNPEMSASEVMKHMISQEDLIQVIKDREDVSKMPAKRQNALAEEVKSQIAVTVILPRDKIPNGFDDVVCFPRKAWIDTGLRKTYIAAFREKAESNMPGSERHAYYSFLADEIENNYYQQKYK